MKLPDNHHDFGDCYHKTATDFDLHPDEQDQLVVASRNGGFLPVLRADTGRHVGTSPRPSRSSAVTAYPARVCADCPKPIGQTNKSGRCLSCVQKHLIATRPDFREAKRRAGRASANVPGERERRSNNAKSRDLYRIGQAARTPETFAMMGRRVSDARMAWCPPEYRDEARSMTKTKSIPLAEVKRIIADQYRVDRAKLRRSLGEDVPGDDVSYIPPAEAGIPGIIDTALALSKLDRSELLSTSRVQSTVNIRQAICFVAYEAGFSTAIIGEHIGRDHTSVIYGRDAARLRAKREPEYALLIDRLRAAVPA